MNPDAGSSALLAGSKVAPTGEEAAQPVAATPEGSSEPSPPPDLGSPTPGAPAGGGLIDQIRDQLAEHAGLIQDTLVLLLKQQNTNLLTELADLRNHNRELRTAINCIREDQQFTRETVEQCLQAAIEQRDAMLQEAVADLQEQQAVLQESMRGLVEDHIGEWRGEVDDLRRRLDAAVANEAAQREAMLTVLREQLAVLREYQHDRDLRTEALLTELLARTGSATGSPSGLGAGMGNRARDWYWRIRGR
jgi:hypothetical protein